MIQRIQTIYLFAAAALLGGAIFSPFARLSILGQDALSKTVTPVDYTNWLALLGLSAALALGAIFLYNNRRLQAQLTLLGTMSTLLSIVLGAFTVNNPNATLSAIKDLSAVQTSFLWGWMLPLVAMFLLWMAARAIRKDEEKVRSMNRLR
jgi:Domain of unknown function (DUF4293)